MDIKYIRRKNLRDQQLKAIKAGLSKADFAEKCGTSASTISQILGDKAGRNLGDDLARKIEKNLGLKHGWLDVQHHETQKNSEVHEAQIIGGIIPWDSKTPLYGDDVEVPFLKEVKISAGSGSLLQEDHNGYKLRFAKSTLRRLNVQPENAVCVEVIGNSMEPVLPDGSTVGVDLGNKIIKDGKMYAIDYGDFLRVKVLYLMPKGRIRIRSYNQDEYDDEECDATEVAVIGKVFWSSVLY